MLTIDKEFHDLIPPLTNEEYNGLETSIIAEGCRDALVIWNDNIIDGHNRFEICNRHGINFRTADKDFNSRNDIKQWIVLNQLSRRNLSDFAKYELMEIYEEIEKEKGKETQGTRTDLLLLNDKKLDKHDTRKNVSIKLGWSTGKTAKAKIVKEKASEEIKEKLRKGDMTVGKAYTIIHRENVIENIKSKPQLPDDKYRIIYADPPWKYGNSMPEGSTEPIDYYPIMSIKELCELPIKDIAEDNAVLFLWVTSPMLGECFDVIKAWEFQYKTSFVWDKVKHNMGHYNSVRHEFLLICVRGSCQPDVQKLHDSVVTEERTEHSKKPEVFRKIIDEIYPYGKRIELFGRETHKGWEVYGNQISR